jgi:hypothetical protein
LREVFVIAQLSTSVSDDQIRLIIVALLVVALLLALLTTWYAIRTSPQRRVRAAQARRGTAGAPPGATRSSTVNLPGDAPAGLTGDGPEQRPTADQVADDDEWMRLTAPQQQRPPDN